MRGRLIGMLLLLTAGVVFVPTAEAALPVERHECGDTITRSIKLGNNIRCSGIHAFALSLNPGVALDLDDHRVSSTDNATPIGILVGTDAHDVVIQDGVISDFATGVSVNGGDRSTIRRLVLPNSRIQVQNSTGSRVVGNVLAGTDVDPVVLQVEAGGETLVARNVVTRGTISNASGNTIEQNTVLASGGPGILAAGGTGGRIVRNTLIGSGDGGPIGAIRIDGTNEIKVSRNRVLGSVTTGIEINTASDVRLTRNTVAGSRLRGIHIFGNSDRTKIVENKIVGNVGNGIETVNVASDTEILENTISQNGGYGLRSFGSSRVAGNKAFYNGLLDGIENDDVFGLEVTSPIGSGKNVAARNDVTGAECFPAFICSPPRRLPPAPDLYGCGDPVPADLTLRYPMNCASGTALTIEVDGIDINLGLNYVSGGETMAGEYALDANADDVTITGGVLADSSTGFRGFGSRYTLDRVTVVRSGIGNGIEFATAEDCIVKRSFVVGGSNGVSAAAMRIAIAGAGSRVSATTIAGNAAGVFALGGAAGGVTIERSRVIGNAFDSLDPAGIQLNGTTDAALRTNTISANDGRGILARNEATGTRIVKNVLRGQGLDTFGAGIVLGEADGGAISSVLRENVVGGSNGDGININNAGSTLNEIVDNRVTGNIENGIRFLAGPTLNTVRANRSHGNGSNGILIAAVDAGGLRRNVANGNGHLNDDVAADGLGISAPIGTPGCENRGAGNDDPDQIEPAALTAAC